MKRLLPFLILLFIFPTPAHAATQTIQLTTAPNRNFSGQFINKIFEKSLDKTGTLGALIFNPVARPRIWIMDAALIEDVQALANENSTIAKDWLIRLKTILGKDRIYATAYGDPDTRYLSALAPAELNFYYVIGQQRLSTILGQNIDTAKSLRNRTSKNKVPDYVRTFFKGTEDQFSLLATVVGQPELEADRVKIAELFNITINETQRDEILSDFQNGMDGVNAKLRIVNGRYRLTNSNEKVPITLVNEFRVPVKINLLFTPLNSRVQFPQYKQITLGPSSKTQISVPIKSITSGETSVIARFENSKNQTVGTAGILDINSTTISSAVSWFTTGAGILLILAAVAQSVRRVRNSRKS